MSHDDAPRVNNRQSTVSSSIFCNLSDGSSDLKSVSSPASKLHALVQATQINQDRYERQENRQQLGLGASQVWNIASLMHNLLRGGRESLGIAETNKAGAGRSRSSSAEEMQLASQPANVAGGQNFSPQQQQLMLTASKGPRIVAFCVKFSQDLLHGELDSTDDKPSAVLARFVTVARRQIMHGFTQSADIDVVGVTYDYKNETLYFALDAIGEDKSGHEAALSKCTDYLADAIAEGTFWIEYPESNLNFCPQQEAIVSSMKRK